jgi:hypothetical protein
VAISIIRLGDRDFLEIEDIAMIPVDRIKNIDMDAPNGGMSGTIRIHTDDATEEWYFVECAEALREFFRKQRIRC